MKRLIGISLEKAPSIRILPLTFLGSKNGTMAAEAMQILRRLDLFSGELRKNIVSPVFRSVVIISKGLVDGLNILSRCLLKYGAIYLSSGPESNKDGRANGCLMVLIGWNFETLLGARPSHASEASENCLEASNGTAKDPAELPIILVIGISCASKHLIRAGSAPLPRPRLPKPLFKKIPTLLFIESPFLKINSSTLNIEPF